MMLCLFAQLKKSNETISYPCACSSPFMKILKILFPYNTIVHVLIWIIASRLGDKFDRPMTLGKLLGNNAPLFIFISILIMTQVISFLHFSLTAVKTGRLGVLPIRIYRGNNAVFVSVDLLGEKNQVILELAFMASQCGQKSVFSNIWNSFSNIWNSFF